MNIEDIIYFAGLFDGEGTVTLTRRNPNEYRSPIISMSSTTKELINFCKGSFGGTICNHKTYKENHKKSYAWSIGNDKALKIMECIKPYIKEPKKLSRINYILDNYKKVTPRNGSYNPEKIEAKLKFEEEFFKII